MNITPISQSFIPFLAKGRDLILAKKVVKANKIVTISTLPMDSSTTYSHCDFDTLKNCSQLKSLLDVANFEDMTAQQVRQKLKQTWNDYF